jgi:hypothetical protein
MDGCVRATDLVDDEDLVVDINGKVISLYNDAVFWIKMSG